MDPNNQSPKRFKVSVDSLILGVAGLVFAGAVVFLFGDFKLFDGGGDKKNTPPVGQFVKSRNDVRRRSEAALSWSPAATQEPVYEGDSIFTGDDSDAAISLDKGGQLNIDPKSLVVIHTQGGQLEVDLQYGALMGKVAENAPIVLNQGGVKQELTAKNAEIRIERTEKAKETRIQVVKGEVRVREKPAVAENTDADGAKSNASAKIPKKPKAPPVEQVLRQDEVVQLAPETKPVVKKIAVRLVLPVNGKHMWLAPDQAIPLEWKPSEGVPETAYRVEVASDSSFSRILHKAEVKGSNYSLPPEGRSQSSVYWRVVPVTDDPNLLPSDAWAMNTHADVAPVQKAPENKATLPGSPVELAWEDGAGSTEFRVVVSKDPSFKQLTIDKKTAAKKESVALEPGSYLWRVQGRHPERAKGAWSQVGYFTVEGKPAAPAGAPLADVSPSGAPQAPGVAAPGTATDPNAQAKAEEPPKEQPLDVPALAQDKIDYTIPEPVLKRMPASVPASNRGVKPENITSFSWKPVPSSAGYEVELAPDEGFTNATKENVQETKFAPQEVRPGSYFVRVRAKNAQGKISEPSSPGRLNVMVPAPKIADVKPETKAYGTAEEWENGTHEFRLSWTPQPFADSYELQWGADKEFTRSKTFRLKESSRNIPVSRPMDYHARVRALDAQGTPISAFSDTQIASFKKELKPELKLAEEKAAREKEEAEKKAKEEAEKAKLAAEKKAKEEAEKAKLAAEQKAKEEEEKARLAAEQKAKEEEEKAKLAAEEKAKKDEDKSRAAASVVAASGAAGGAAAQAATGAAASAAPATAAAAASSASVPQEKVAGMSSMIRSPTLREPKADASLVSLEGSPVFVNFKWQAVPGANYYTLQISGDSEFSSVVTESKVRNTNILMEKKLPDGKLYWRVRAHTPNGISAWSKPSNIRVMNN